MIVTYLILSSSNLLEAFEIIKDSFTYSCIVIYTQDILIKQLLLYRINTCYVI